MNTPPRRALVVIDVQNEYVTGALRIEYPPIDSSLPRIAQAMDAARAAQVPIVVVQATLPAAAEVFVRGTPSWELHPLIAQRPRDHHIEKRWPSVFTETDFADWLAERQIGTLTIAGYMTHNCNASTVLEAMHRGLQVEFLSDATGSLPYANDAGRATAEEIHRIFSVVFHTAFASVVSTDTWVAALNDGVALPRDNILASNQRATGR